MNKLTERPEKIVQQEERHLPVDKKLVHKHNIENVFIANLRKSLPLKISWGDYYIFSDNASELEKSIFDRHYVPGQNSNSDFFILMEEPQYADCELATLSDFFQSCKIDSENLFFAEMIFNPGHPYYFEHPNDHVPGMMLIESVRQMIVACSHKYGGAPIENSFFIVSGINVQFLNYVELSESVQLMLALGDCFVNATGSWADAIFDVTICQNNKQNAKMIFKGNILTKRAYDRIMASRKLNAKG
ncbi:MAG: hypothetical protein OEV66_04115 [Spirochaetia bacterium]|nr:hypothetical protein [Spirochaetia bacterium]